MSAAVRNSIALPSAAFVFRVAALALLLLELASLGWAQDESLGDYARKLRSHQQAQVLVSPEEGKLLFQSVDEIIRFSSEDSGLPRLGSVKRKLIGRADVEKYFTSKTKDDAEQQSHIAEAGVMLKKFGLLPVNFEFGSSSRDFTVGALAGFYLTGDKTMYLMDWIAPEMQKNVMAHELTHALQDQSFQLEMFLRTAALERSGPQMQVNRDDAAELALARRAVVEGQATIVETDFELQALNPQLHLNLADSPRARELAQSIIAASYDPPVRINNAPRLLREILMFPYQQGMQFELALLEHGRQAAFQGAFRRPPINTHQILHPDAYLKNEKTPRVDIPDLTPIFGNAYEPYDSGGLGEFDVQIMSEEYGRENDIYTVAHKWDGGAYVAVKRSGLVPGTKVTTADLALVYVSRWTTREAAERFGRIYLEAMAKRLPIGTPVQQSCSQEKCPGALWEQHALTSEGPVNIELWPGNLLIITHSVDDERMKALRPILLTSATRSKTHAVAQQELIPRLFAIPQIQALSLQAGFEFSQQLAQRLTH